MIIFRSDDRPGDLDEIVWMKKVSELIGLYAGEMFFRVAGRSYPRRLHRAVGKHLVEIQRLLEQAK